MLVRPSCFSLIRKLALPVSEYTPFAAGWSSMRARRGSSLLMDTAYAVIFFPSL
jgi:hypothetical protein